MKLWIWVKLSIENIGRGEKKKREKKGVEDRGRERRGGRGRGFTDKLVRCDILTQPEKNGHQLLA